MTKAIDKSLSYIVLKLKALGLNGCSISQHSSPYLYIELASKLELMGLLLIIVLILLWLIFKSFYLGQSTVLKVVYSQLTVQITDKREFSKPEVFSRQALYPHFIYTFGLNFCTLYWHTGYLE